MALTDYQKAFLKRDLIQKTQVIDPATGVSVDWDALGGTSVTGTSDVPGLDAALAGKQPLDSDLTAIAALSTTSFGRSLLAAADAAALRTLAGTDAAYQPVDSDLTAIAALSTTSYGRSLLAAADAAALRTLSGALADHDVITYLDATGAAAPGTPASGKARIYAKTDNRIYSKGSDGVEHGPFDAAAVAAGAGTFVQAKSVTNTATTTASVVLDAAPTNGNLLILSMCSNNATVVPTVVSQTGVTWTHITSTTYNTGSQVPTDIWKGVVGSGASATVSVTIPSGNGWNQGYGVVEFSGLTTVEASHAVRGGGDLDGNAANYVLWTTAGGRVFSFMGTRGATMADPSSPWVSHVNVAITGVGRLGIHSHPSPAGVVMGLTLVPGAAQFAWLMSAVLP